MTLGISAKVPCITISNYRIPAFAGMTHGAGMTIQPVYDKIHRIGFLFEKGDINDEENRGDHQTF